MHGSVARRFGIVALDESAGERRDLFGACKPLIALIVQHLLNMMGACVRARYLVALLGCLSLHNLDGLSCFAGMRLTSQVVQEFNQNPFHFRLSYYDLSAVEVSPLAVAGLR